MAGRFQPEFARQRTRLRVGMGVVVNLPFHSQMPITKVGSSATMSNWLSLIMRTSFLSLMFNWLFQDALLLSTLSSLSRGISSLQIEAPPCVNRGTAARKLRSQGLISSRLSSPVPQKISSLDNYYYLVQNSDQRRKAEQRLARPVGSIYNYNYSLE